MCPGIVPFADGISATPNGIGPFGSENRSLAERIVPFAEKIVPSSNRSLHFDIFLLLVPKLHLGMPCP